MPLTMSLGVVMLQSHHWSNSASKASPAQAIDMNQRCSLLYFRTYLYAASMGLGSSFNQPSTESDPDTAAAVAHSCPV